MLCTVTNDNSTVPAILIGPATIDNKPHYIVKVASGQLLVLPPKQVSLNHDTAAFSHLGKSILSAAKEVSPCQYANLKSPFTAITALVNIISSLAALARRMHDRMTPEEQRLFNSLQIKKDL